MLAQVKWYAVLGLLVSGVAGADIQYQDFSLRPNERFTVTLIVNGATAVLNGTANAETLVNVSKDNVQIGLRSFMKDSFVTVMAWAPGDINASLFIFEKDGGKSSYKKLGTKPLIGLVGSMETSLDLIFSNYKTWKKWDAGQALKKLADYVDTHGNISVDAYSEDMRDDSPDFTSVPKPSPRGGSRPAPQLGNAGPQVPAPSAGSDSPQPDVQQPVDQPQQPGVQPQQPQQNLPANSRPPRNSRHLKPQMIDPGNNFGFGNGNVTYFDDSPDAGPATQAPVNPRRQPVQPSNSGAADDPFAP